MGRGEGKKIKIKKMKQAENEKGFEETSITNFFFAFSFSRMYTINTREISLEHRSLLFTIFSFESLLSPYLP